MSYIDYGNSEVVSRSAVVELPVDLQSPSLAKKYKFWGFHVSSDHDSQHFKQVRLLSSLSLRCWDDYKDVPVVFFH